MRTKDEGPTGCMRCYWIGAPHEFDEHLCLDLTKTNPITWSKKVNIVIDNARREKLGDQIQWLRGFLQGISYFGEGAMGHALENAENSVMEIQTLIFDQERKAA